MWCYEHSCVGILASVITGSSSKPTKRSVLVQMNLSQEPIFTTSLQLATTFMKYHSNHSVPIQLHLQLHSLFKFMLHTVRSSRRQNSLLCFSASPLPQGILTCISYIGICTFAPLPAGRKGWSLNTCRLLPSNSPTKQNQFRVKNGMQLKIINSSLLLCYW